MKNPVSLVAFAVATVLFGYGYGEARDRDEQTIRCESTGEKATYCQTHTTGVVELQRQLSRARCDKYDTWGSDEDGGGIWVRDGCRADFVVREQRGWGGWHGHHGHHRHHDDDDRPEVSRIHCTSQDWAYEHCEVGGRISDARIVRQISKTDCTRGDNWGVDRSGIWVDRGCEAEFEVR
jgi:hypothetical protein